MLTTRTKHDWGTIFSEFFQLKDWKQRSLYIGGLYLVLFSAWIMFNIAFFIGLSSGFSALILLILFLLAQTPLVLIVVYSLYLNGYQIELAGMMLEEKQLEDLNYFADYTARIKQGCKLLLSVSIYNIIPFLIIISGYMFIILLSIIQDSRSGFVEPGVSYISMLGSILSFILLLGGVVLQMFVQFIITPLITARFIIKKSISTTIDFFEVKRHTERYILDLLLIGLIMYIIQTLYSFALYFSLITVFICVGLFLFPVIFAVGVVYSLHVRARIISNLSKTMKFESS